MKKELIAMVKTKTEKAGANPIHKQSQLSVKLTSIISDYQGQSRSGAELEVAEKTVADRKQFIKTFK